MNYLGKELYNKVDCLVSRAFHEIYAICDDNWCDIVGIQMDYCVCEELGDFPLVAIEVACGTKVDGNFSMTLHYRLDWNDERNIGYFVKELECYEDN